MSNYLAIATITATLQRTLQDSVQGDIDGVRVTAVKPGAIGSGTPELGINLFLYHVARNPAISPDLGSSRLKLPGSRRQTPLELSYMLSFYGNDNELEPHRLMGSVIRTFSDRTVISPDMIQDTIADSSFSFLTHSDLAEQIQQIVISPLDMTVEDLSKTWSVFFQAPYLLSIAYKVTAVIIDGEETGKRALPVRDRSYKGILPFAHYPILEQVVSQVGPLEPILHNSALLIRGRQLKSPQTMIRIGSVECIVEPEAYLSDTQLVFALDSMSTANLRAGVQDLQVIHRRQEGDRIQQAESNVLPFVLRPRIQSIDVEHRSGRGNDLRSVTVSMLLDLPVGMNQRVVLLLNEWSTDNPKTYAFKVPIRQMDSDQLVLTIDEVHPSEYLVRVQIDGADSLLEVDSKPDSATFNWYDSPKIVIE
jgi:Pvc16 N-terminal domain